ncbi:diguanylate cyclase (GGDEF)-like protein [Variovorax sp. SG517]|uniref:GGDEF domain-containing protein n=1 Tax=Variovorax sp. SG517 TaxID=2587117 RepID=UPI00159D6DC6|nr:GGDEF domain-containing protein [Variovorax sp. SG517]NVM86787.1 diguanylate cyclase (GGDEF)-like protein [Variovorax sp. SG517]
MIVCYPSVDERARLKDFLRLIKPISVGVQVIGFVFWGAAWWLADPGYEYVTWHLALLACCVALSIAGSCATRFLSFFSIISVWLLCLGFSMLMAQSPDREVWAVSMSVIVSVVGAPLFSRLSLSALASSGAWLIMGRGEWVGTPHGLDSGWTLLMPCGTITMGLLMNVIFATLHRESLRLRQELEQLAYKDVLTGMCNRRKLLADVQQLHEQGRLGDGCFLMIDVDDFKKINDDFGHAAGDLALQRVAAVLREAALGHALGRLGGEEFGIMLTGGGTAHAQSMAARILEQVRGIRIEGRLVTVSVGISDLGRHRIPSELMREADMALYEAKRMGKDRFALHVVG